MATPSVQPGPTPHFHVDNKASEEALLHGAAVITIWAIIFFAWLWKQYKKRIRAKRRAAKGLPPKVKNPKKPLPTFIVPPDPAVITGQREPGERAIPRKHNSMDKNAPTPSIELNERNRPINEVGAHDEMLARQIFSKRSSLDPPKHNHPSRSSTG
ncbi:hypothetical protein DFH94DRAFT_691038 [Russula ochroleuca]|uniref:Uncharacterized protein n=1 Tax=Russula ochroleuca TaxID=152965 RepID=A0A9P5TBI8_9AGAM|nr:hypothetical protein DFH94DRAFT_691038 [Russula ochroleuca]